MSFTVFSVAIILIFVTTAAIEIHRGRVRGFNKSLISLGCVAVSIILSLTLSPILSQGIVNTIFTVFVRRLRIYHDYISAFKSLDLAVEALVSIVFSIFLFVLLFFIIRGLIGALVSLFFGRKLKQRESDHSYSNEKDSFFARNSKVMGGVAGLVSAVLITMVVTSPVMGFLDLAGKSIGAAESINKNIWAQLRIDAKSMDKLEEYSDDIPGNIFYRFGGEYMFRSSASTELYGRRVYLTNEIDIILDIASDFNYVYTVLKRPEKYGPGYQKYIDSLCENISELNICHGVLAEFLAMDAKAWLDNGNVLLMAKPQVSEIVEPIFDSVIGICAESNQSNIRENTVTLLRIYSIILESNIMKAETPEAIIDCIKQSNIINKLQVELSANPNMNNIRISSLALNVLARQVDQNKSDDENYSHLISNIADAVSTVQNKGYGSAEERVEVLTDKVKQYISDYGVNITDEMAQYTAEELLAVLQSNGELLTAEQIDDLFAQYGNYASAQGD